MSSIFRNTEYRNFFNESYKNYSYLSNYRVIEIPPGFDSIRFQGIFDKTGGKDITFTPDASQANLGLVGVWPGGSETTYQINGNAPLSSSLTAPGPFVLGTISAPASLFGTITDGTGAGTSSDQWELQDLIKPDGGSAGFGFVGIEFTDANPPVTLTADDVLNYVEGGDNTGGGPSPSEPVVVPAVKVYEPPLPLFPCPI